MYRSRYEAYPFLCDAGNDLRCDFELCTDEMSSMTGMLRTQIKDKALREELTWINGFIYNINPTLRTFMSVTDEEIEQLAGITEGLKDQCIGRCERFVLPQGSEAACMAHMLRVKAKMLVRLLYRHAEQGNKIPDTLFDAANLLSGYFFYLALYLNKTEDVDEIPFISRNYKL